ncbi:MULTISPECIES: hypothetical protein [Mammaliicoccus]|uniref:hypothetical protein n=1 Tax=Mammaliicoccus TaxID=2803850 RepID=UPI001AACE636|nr:MULTISPECIES: hypothetical protein [Mammaliicoccus]MBO3061484.1 hypothetical protein [Mammaliicoccus fleurettii]MEB7724146.1 hypothetical protein [Mammaliicoccus fleurettii]MEB8068507.1 hypothetical protein [Mammaliicoccus fleurettii]
MNKLMKNRELLVLIFVFLIVGLGIGLSAIFTFEKALYFIVPIFIAFAIFFSWLRGQEEAKNLKYFMIFKISELSIISLISLIYLTRSEQVKSKYVIVIILIWSVIGLISDYIEKRYFLKKKNTENE